MSGNRRGARRPRARGQVSRSAAAGTGPTLRLTGGGSLRRSTLYCDGGQCCAVSWHHDGNHGAHAQNEKQEAASPHHAVKQSSLQRSPLRGDGARTDGSVDGRQDDEEHVEQPPAETSTRPAEDFGSRKAIGGGIEDEKEMNDDQRR